MSDDKNLKKFQTIKSYAFNDFSSYGYEEDILEKEFLSWNIKDGNLNHLKDSIWHFFNRLISEFSRDFQTQAQIYWSMAVFDYKYGNGKMVNMMKKSSADAKIHHYESTTDSNGIITYNLVIIVGKDACAVCKADDGRKFEINDLVKSNPLPHKNCTCAGFGCTCMLGAVAKRDNNGDLIFNLDDLPSEKPVVSKKPQVSNDFVKHFARGFFSLLGVSKKRK